jgi:hypothetical protein
MRHCIYSPVPYNLYRAWNGNMNVNGELKYVEVIGRVMYQYTTLHLAFSIHYQSTCNFGWRFFFSLIQIFKCTTCVGPTGHHHAYFYCSKFFFMLALCHHESAQHLRFRWSDFLSCFGVRYIKFSLLCDRPSDLHSATGCCNIILII